MWLPPARPFWQWLRQLTSTEYNSWRWLPEEGGQPVVFPIAGPILKEDQNSTSQNPPQVGTVLTLTSRKPGQTFLNKQESVLLNRRSPVDNRWHQQHLSFLSGKQKRSQKSPEDFPCKLISQSWITSTSLGAGEVGKVGTGLSRVCAWIPGHCCSEQSPGSVSIKEEGKGF